MIPRWVRRARRVGHFPWLGIALALLAVALRLYRADAQSLWYDEGTSAALAGRDALAIVHAAANDIHPPLYYLILAGWSRLFGDGVTALRGLSAVIGGIGAFGTWLLARRVAGPTVAALATIGAAVSPFLVWYGQEVRMYALAGALGAWLPWAALGWFGAVARPLERRDRLGLECEAETSDEGERGEPASRGRRRHAAVASLTDGPAELDVGVSDQPQGEAPTGSAVAARAWAVLYAVLASASLYNHYFAGAAALAAANLVVGIAWLQDRPPRGGSLRAASIWVGLQFIVVAVFVPWLAVAWPTIRTWPALGEPVGPSFAALEATIAYALGAFPPASLRSTWPLLAGVAAAGAISWVQAGASTRGHPGGERSATASGSARPGGGHRGDGPGAAVPIPTNEHRLDGASGRWAFAIAAACAGTGPALQAAMSLVRPAWNPKLLIAGAPGFELLLGLGCLAIGGAVAGAFARVRHASPTWLPTALAVGVMLSVVLPPRTMALAAMYHDPQHQRDDYRGIVREISAAARPDTAVLLNAPTQIEIFEYYARGSLPTYPLPRQRPPDERDLRAALETIAAENGDLYAVLWATEESDPEGWTERWLDATHHKAFDRWFGNVRLALWAEPRAPMEELLETPVRFAQGPERSGLQLDSLSIGPSNEPVPAGDVITLEALWSVPAQGAPVSDLVTTLQLIDHNSQMVAQRDMRPIGGRAATSTWRPGATYRDLLALALPPESRPGTYQLQLAVYDPATGERMPPDPTAVSGTTHDTAREPSAIQAAAPPLPRTVAARTALSLGEIEVAAR